MRENKKNNGRNKMIAKLNKIEFAAEINNMSQEQLIDELKEIKNYKTSCYTRADTDYARKMIKAQIN
jgi:hypothetical protein